MAKIDFEAEGLLEGLEGEAREARAALLGDLSEQGVALDELRSAVAAGRLALIPVERALMGDGPRYTGSEVAEKAGVDLGLLARALAALGVPIPGPEDRILTDADVASAKRVVAFRELGISEEGILQVSRTIGMAMARIAEANRELVISTVVHEGDSERDLAERFAASARAMIPLVGPTLAYTLQIHLLEQVRRDVIGAADLAGGDVGGAREMAVCFADMVGFTKLGEQIEIQELGLIAGRLEEMASAVAQPPVRLVKTIGDAVMLVSSETGPMLEAALTLVEAADEEGESFPQLRAGVAEGAVLPQAGDFYGRPVNLASRITGVARPGSVVADQGAAGDEGAAPDGGFRFSSMREQRLKGIDGRVRLFRVRRGGTDEAESS